MSRTLAEHEARRLTDLGSVLIRVGVGLGIVGLGAAAAFGLDDEASRTRFFFSYLIAFSFFLSLALGGLFFIILQHLTRSGWSVAVRRVAEGLASTMPLLALAAIPVLLGLHTLYHWTHAEAVQGDAVLQSKTWWLAEGFFIARIVAYFVIWSAMAFYFWRKSVAQDQDGDVNTTITMQKVAAPCMIVYALTVTLASFDLLMSLDPHWFSTIFGLYFFAGGVVGFYAVMILAFALLQRSGRLTHSVTSEHFHDLGKMMFAFVVLWAYFAYSQYMLIWYGNIPEETEWFLKRQDRHWASASLILIAVHFLAPFLLLISRVAKRTVKFAVPLSLFCLAAHWFDLYWLVMPEASVLHPSVARPGHMNAHWLDLACTLGLGGFFVAVAAYHLKGASLVPERDPRLGESLSFENF